MFCNPYPQGAVRRTPQHNFRCLSCPRPTIQVDVRVRERKGKIKQDIVIVRKMACSWIRPEGVFNLCGPDILDPNPGVITDHQTVWNPNEVDGRWSHFFFFFNSVFIFFKKCKFQLINT